MAQRPPEQGPRGAGKGWTGTHTQALRGARGVRGHCKQDAHTATWPHEAAHWTQTCWDVSPGPWEGAPLGQSLSGKRHDGGCGAGVPSPHPWSKACPRLGASWTSGRSAWQRPHGLCTPARPCPSGPPRCGRPSCRHPHPVFLPLPVCASEFLASKGTSKRQHAPMLPLKLVP